MFHLRKRPGRAEGRTLFPGSRSRVRERARASDPATRSGDARFADLTLTDHAKGTDRIHLLTTEPRRRGPCVSIPDDLGAFSSGPLECSSLSLLLTVWLMLSVHELALLSEFRGSHVSRNDGR